MGHYAGDRDEFAEAIAVRQEKDFSLLNLYMLWVDMEFLLQHAAWKKCVDTLLRRVAVRSWQEHR
ncbi:hypothetical protein ABKS89_19415 [Pseudomonas sp. LABIM340]|uniref:hypothetical protein n=1 Tax=Pseudomonas sp. LABIM340 TaxID=3156585 RepID=UPI0032AEB368